MIDLRVMNDFSHNEQAAILENLASSVCKIDRAFDAVAKTKLLRQAHCRISHRNYSAGAPDLFDDIAPVVRLDLLLHGGHHVRRAQVHSLAGSCAAGNQVSAHVGMVVIPSEAKCSRGIPRNYRTVAQRDVSTSLDMTRWLTCHAAARTAIQVRPAYSSSGPLGASNAASVIMREAGGSGV